LSGGISSFLKITPRDLVVWYFTLQGCSISFFIDNYRDNQYIRAMKLIERTFAFRKRVNFCFRISLYASIFLILISSVSLAQDQNKTSELLNRLESADEESKPGLYNELSKQFLGISLQKSLEYAELALAGARNSGDLNQEELALANIGTNYNSQGNPDKALGYFEDALRMHGTNKFSETYVTILAGIGDVHRIKGEYEIALELYFDALEQCEKNHDEPGSA
jgi:tetratricopeptide (TPR) repeat protein